MKTLTNIDFARAAGELGVEEACIRAVCEVEAPRGGFDENGLPRILFEGHHFSRFTEHVYDQTHPRVSHREPTRRFYSSTNTGEHARLATATALNREAALKSASWGRFQIMGFNYAAAGHKSLQSFINAMFDSEGAQLDAFISFLKNDRGGRMVTWLRDHNWSKFARDYNGPSYASNQYDSKLAAAFIKWSAVK